MKKKIVLLLLLLTATFGMAQNARFWDGIEAFDGPTDDNPVLAAQIDYYFDKMVSPLPDSITLEINRLVDRIGDNTDLRNFFLWHLLHKYQHPDYMAQDQVFVWLYDEYFSKLKIKDLYDDNRALIQEKAERLRRLALFNVAPNFPISDSLDLQSVEGDYVVVFFYDHDCDLCQQEMRDLDSVAGQFPEIQIIAIDLNTDDIRIDALYDLYDIETTPLIYVLDCDKRIIAKKIRARQIPLVL